MADIATGYAVRNTEAYVDAHGLLYSFINPSSHYWYSNVDDAQLLAKHIQAHAYPNAQVVRVTITTEFHYAN